jgi:hypothetical protein
MASTLGPVIANHPLSKIIPTGCPAWGPFFERKTRKMRPHGGRLLRDFMARRVPQNGRLKRDFKSVSDTSFQQNAEFKYHKNA